MLAEVGWRGVLSGDLKGRFNVDVVVEGDVRRRLRGGGEDIVRVSRRNTLG